MSGEDSHTVLGVIDGVLVLLNARRISSAVQNAPGETFAQVIFYQKGFTYDATPNDFDCNVRLITGVDKFSYFDRYLSAIG